MFPETECGICYQAYNLGRRCPRQLGCKHTFCESCLVTIWRSAQSLEHQIVCPLCRHCTPLSEERFHETLPVDEDMFERVATAEDDDNPEEPQLDAVIPPTDDASPAPRSRKSRLMKCFSHLRQKFNGDARRNCMTDVDLKDLAMMACYMM